MVPDTQVVAFGKRLSGSDKPKALDTWSVAMGTSDSDRSKEPDTQHPAFGKPSIPDRSTESDRPMALDKPFGSGKRSVFGKPFLGLDTKVAAGMSAFAIPHHSLAQPTSRLATRRHRRRQRPQSWQLFDPNRHRTGCRSIHLRQHRRGLRPLALCRSVEPTRCRHH